MSGAFCQRSNIDLAAAWGTDCRVGEAGPGEVRAEAVDWADRGWFRRGWQWPREREMWRSGRTAKIKKGTADLLTGRTEGMCVCGC